MINTEIFKMVFGANKSLCDEQKISLVGWTSENSIVVQNDETDILPSTRLTHIIDKIVMIIIIVIISQLVDIELTQYQAFLSICSSNNKLNKIILI